ncbi:MAG: CHAT domain-containing protein [Acidobacteria bacterium]|nr:CHAT domain-containing protein [Acidobacteriota bacterium]
MNEQPLTDFCWIRIRIFGQDADGLYRVEAELDDGSWHKQMMKLGDEEEEELIRRRDLGTRSYGQYLYQLLFMKPPGTDGNLTELSLHDVFQKAWGRTQASELKELRVQLWISEECNELHRIRWERLYVRFDDHWRSLANFEQTPFSRFTRLPIAEPQLNPDDRPLRVLLVVSNPSDLGDDGDDPDALKLAEINVEQEISNFYEAVKDIADIEVSVMPGRTGISDELKAKLKAPKFHLIPGNTTISQIQQQFNHHVLHFLGHGVFERVAAPATAEAAKAAAQPRQRAQRATLLVLENDDGKSNKVSDDLIVDYLVHRGTLPRLVFLSACDTVKFDERNPSPFTGLGPKLVAAGFPAVVAMQDQVPIAMARELVEKFYCNLLSEGVIDLALNRSRLFSFDPDNLLDNWTIPVLFMRTPRGRLFTANKERETLRATLESPTLRQIFKYGPLPLEAVMLVGDQIKSNWENQVLPQQGLMDLHMQLMALLEDYEGKQPMLVAITGQRGTARSTALRWLATCTAQKSLEADSRKQILPIYVDLQKCIPASNAVPPYLSLLAQSLSEFWPGTLTEKEMDKLLNDGKHRFRFFFDHGDDLSEAQRKALTKIINDLLNDYPKYPCFVTQTRGLWDWHTSYVTHLLDVQPLSRRRIIRFLFDSANLEQRLREERGETTESREEQNLRTLRARLEETQLFDLAGMPWMFVQLIKQALNGDFPESRVCVLRDLVEEKVCDVTQRRGQQARALETLYLLAYRMQVSGETVMPIKDSLELFSKVRDNREYQLEEMLDSLVSIDILARAGGDAVRFLYPSYQAYFCAQYLKVQNNPKRWEEITASLGRINNLRRWDDTLTLMAGMMADPKELLEKIAYSTSLKEGEQVFLAARCLLEARLNGNGSKANEALVYVESLVMDALVWRSDSTNEPRSFQRLRAVEALGRFRRLDVMPYLVRVVMKKTRVNSNGREDFEYGGIRQAAGRALRRLLPPREKADPNEEYTAELHKLCPELEEVIQKWIRAGAAEISWLEKRMRQPNPAKKDERKVTVNDALASMAAFALGDLRDDDAHEKLIDAFIDDNTSEVIRWAITDALTTLEPELVMDNAILPLLESGKLDDPIKFGERREQLIYLIGQLRHPEEKARAFVEEVLKSPRNIILQKGRAILAISYLLPPEWKMWKTQFENIVLNEDNIIAKKVSEKSKGFYLRTKALQALAEIGDAETLKRLREKRQQMPTELERVFYSTSEEIIWRNNG